MNYITSCPECGTQFLLNKEHLKAHRGKVQCGHCTHIFNAKNRVVEISDDITSAAEYQASLESPNQENLDPENAIQEANGQSADESINQTPLSSEGEATESPIYIGEFSPTITEPIIIEDLATHSKYLKKPTKLNIWLCLLCLVLLILSLKI